MQFRCRWVRSNFQQQGLLFLTTSEDFTRGSTLIFQSNFTCWSNKWLSNLKALKTYLGHDVVHGIRSRLGTDKQPEVRMRFQLGSFHFLVERWQPLGYQMDILRMEIRIIFVDILTAYNLIGWLSGIKQCMLIPNIWIRWEFANDNLPARWPSARV